LDPARRDLTGEPAPKSVPFTKAGGGELPGEAHAIVVSVDVARPGKAVAGEAPLPRSINGTGMSALPRA
jgi:hypothetical protein